MSLERLECACLVAEEAQALANLAVYAGLAAKAASEAGLLDEADRMLGRGDAMIEASKRLQALCKQMKESAP
jgi:hypothetical protein